MAAAERRHDDAFALAEVVAPGARMREALEQAEGMCPSSRRQLDLGELCPKWEIGEWNRPAFTALLAHGDVVTSMPMTATFAPKIVVSNGKARRSSTTHCHAHACSFGPYASCMA